MRLETSDLKTLMAVASAASKDMSRLTLTQVLIERHRDDGGRVVAVATDSYRLAAAPIKVDVFAGNNPDGTTPFKALVPVAFLTAVKRAAGRSAPTITITVDGDSVATATCSVDGLAFEAKGLAGDKFPNWRGLLPAKYEPSDQLAWFNPSLMADAAKFFTAIGLLDAGNRVSAVAVDHLEQSMFTTPNGAIWIQMPIRVTGEVATWATDEQDGAA